MYTHIYIYIYTLQYIYIQFGLYTSLSIYISLSGIWSGPSRGACSSSRFSGVAGWANSYLSNLHLIISLETKE